MLIKKKQSCQNKPNESYTERKAIYEPCGYALNLVCLFDSKPNKQTFYGGKDCMKRFCSELKELATNGINYKNKEIIPLADSEKRY